MTGVTRYCPTVPGERSTSRLWGRDDELDLLRDRLERVERGAMVPVVLEGEAGIGKSALLAAALDEARDRGFGVWSGQAQELESARPFGVWTAALRCTPDADDPARARIARLLAPPTRPEPSLTVTSDPGLRFQVVDAVVDLVEDLADERPTAIGLDDLQWADPESLLTLTALVRRLAPAPVLVIASARPPTPGGELARVLVNLEQAGAARLPLGPLPEDQVAGVVADVLRAEPAADLLRQVRAAGGNPLYVTELVRAVSRDAARCAASGRAEPVASAWPPSLGLTIVRHLSFLSEQALEVLRPASVLGARFAVAALSTVTARSVGELAPGISEAVAAGLLGEDGDGMRFRHDLIRDAVYDDLPRSVRQAWHRQAGHRLAAAGASSLLVAEHLLRGPAVDDATLGWVRDAARDIAPGSPATAAALLERGVSALAPDDPRRIELQGERAGDLLWAGRTREAESLFRELLGRGPGPTLARSLRWGLVRSLFVEGRVAEGLEEVTHLEGELPDPPGGAESRAWLAMARTAVGDLDGATTAATGVLESPEGREHGFAAAMALGALAVVAETRGELHEALDLIDRAVPPAAVGVSDATRRYPAQVTRAHILVELDRAEQAAEALAGQVPGGPVAGWPALDGDAGPSWHAARIVAGFGRFVLGDWDEAETVLETGLELVEETGQASNAVFGRSLLSLLAQHRGRGAEAQRLAGLARRQVEATGPSYRSEWVALARARVLEAEGDPVRAYAVLAQSWDRCTRLGARVELPVLGPDLLRLALASDDRARAADVVGELDELAARHAVGSFAAAALRCRGLWDRDPEPLLAGVELYARSGRLPALALSAEDAAKVSAGRGATQDARVLLERAASTFERLDAAHDIARVDARLRGLGVHRGRRGARSRPRTGWASLTPTETRVVDLVAQGLSNPEVGARLYLSRRTVQTHLTHVFAKLDVTSRAQLAAEAVRRSAP